MTVYRIKGEYCNWRTVWGNNDDDDNRRGSVFRPKRRDYDLEVTIFRVWCWVEYRALDPMISFLNTEIFNTRRGFDKAVFPTARAKERYQESLDLPIKMKRWRGEWQNIQSWAEKGGGLRSELSVSFCTSRMDIIGTLTNAISLKVATASIQACQNLHFTN